MAWPWALWRRWGAPRTQRSVWGIDYFLTLPDTRGTILSDRDLNDYRDNNGDGEDNNLKTEYDPVNIREDMLIEHIIIGAKLEGRLE